MTRIGRWAEHRWAEPRMSAYVDGELSPRARRRFARHAEACPACGPTLRSLVRVIQALRTLPRARHPKAAAAVVRRLRVEPSEAGASDAT